DVASTPFDLSAEPRGARYMTTIYYPTWTRLDGLLAGGVGAAVPTFWAGGGGRRTARPGRLPGGGLGAVAGAGLFFHAPLAGLLPAVFGYPLLALGVAALVAAGSDARSIIGRVAVPGAGALATGAYSLYLSHKMVFHAVQSAAPHWPAPLQPLALPVALI